MSWRVARVIRGGSALALDGAEGTRVVRRVDLEEVLGRADVDGPRFAGVRLDGPDLRVTLTDGAEEHIEAAELDGQRRAVVIDGIGQLVTADGSRDDVLGVLHDAAVVCRGDTLEWLGPRAELASALRDLGITPTDRIDAGGRLVTPGLVDCHAHPIFAGSRADEFGLRARGAGYQEIAAAGGGIAATVRATRAASVSELARSCAGRLDRALAAGTTTCEAKSGYDLTVDGELRMLEVAQLVDGLHRVDLWPTLLGAHTLPPELDRTSSAQRDGFVAQVADEMIPRAAQAQLARAADVYLDEGAFTAGEARRILTAARAAGLAVRAHVGQFADLGGAELIAELGGLSADHLEVVSAAGMRAMAEAGVVAVMLPGACVQLRMQPPPVEALRAAGVALAVGTDMNPGTTLCEGLTVPMWLACTHYGMTVEETWLGVTRHAASAIGRHDVGILTVGARADLVVWDAECPAEIPYRYGARLPRWVIKSGRVHELA